MNLQPRYIIKDGKIQFLDSSWYSVEELKKLIDKINGEGIDSV